MYATTATVLVCVNVCICTLTCNLFRHERAVAARRLDRVRVPRDPPGTCRVLHFTAFY